MTRYPFHLRPKNKQALQYIRMAGDLVRDLELDQEPPEFADGPNINVSDQQLDKIRAYLAWHYSVSAYVPISSHQTTTDTSSFLTGLKHFQHLAAPFTSWTATCCNILERNAQVEGDLILIALVRISSDIHAVTDAIYGKDEGQNQLILLGLEARHRNLRQKMLPHIARSRMHPTPGILLLAYISQHPSRSQTSSSTSTTTAAPSSASPAPNPPPPTSPPSPAPSSASASQP